MNVLFREARQPIPSDAPTAIARLLVLQELDDKVFVEAKEAKDENQLAPHFHQLLFVMAGREVACIVKAINGSSHTTNLLSLLLAIASVRQVAGLRID